jgi:hypothetical protein
MPNHCDNTIYVHGPKAIVDEVIAKHFADTGELNCESVIPYPKEYKLADEVSRNWNERAKTDKTLNWKDRPTDGFNSGGYEWCVANWGTKWGTYDGNGLNRTTRGFNAGFMSAWSPPTPAVTALAAKYPTIKIQMKSYEAGMGYKVNATWENGELCGEDETTYSGHRGG